MRDSIPGREKDFFLLSRTPKPPVGPTQPPAQRLPGLISRSEVAGGLRLTIECRGKK